jgi:ATP-dependent DNA helicase RecG
MATDRWSRRKVGQQTEYLPAPDAARMAETMVAFANADGGTIIVGADASGELQAGVLVEEIESALREALARCRPPVRLEWSVGEAGGLPVYLQVQRSPELHSLDDGRVLIRSGQTNRPLGGEEIRRLAAGKGSGDFEQEVVEGASVDDFDPAVVDEYLRKRHERLPHVPIGAPQRILTEIGALDAAGRPTVAGLLLFGRNPQAYLPKTGLTFVHFLEGVSQRDAIQPSAQYGRREDITGPLPTIIRESWELLRQEMHPQVAVNGLTRQERTDYPVVAVREALVNAVAHRDYSLKGRQIEIRVFEDRMEIISPGGLPGYITLDNIVDEHFSRNPRIVNGLYYWGYIEELGTGIDRMIQAMSEAGLPEPAFDPTPFTFKVTLRNTRVRAPSYEWEGDMNERQLKALNYVQTHGQITNREYRDLCPNVSAETLRLDLADLVSRGILLRIGDKRGTYYILK